MLVMILTLAVIVVAFFLPYFSFKAGAEIAEQKERSQDAKILMTIGVLTLIPFFVCLTIVLYLMFNMDEWVGKPFFVNYVIILFVCIWSLKILKIWQPFKTDKQNRRSMNIAAIVCSIVVVIIPIFAYFNGEFVTVDTENEVNVRAEYRPFVSEKLAVLDEPSTLKFENNFPIIDGATALYPLYAAFAQAVYPETADIGKIVKCSTTEGALDNLLHGKADIAFVMDVDNETMDNLKSKGRSVTMTPIGKEAFVFFTNYKNVCDNISSDEIEEIFTGELTQWLSIKNSSQLGGIEIYGRDYYSGSQVALRKIIQGEVIEPKNVHTTMSGVAEATAYVNNKTALSYSFRYYLESIIPKETSEKLKILKINNIAPTVENIQNDTYPYTQQFYAVTVGTPKENVQLFLDWITSEQGQSLVEKTGYTPIG